MTWAQDILLTVAWQNLTPAGQIVIDAMQAGSKPLSPVVVVPLVDNGRWGGTEPRACRRRLQSRQKLAARSFPVAEELGIGVSTQAGEVKRWLLLRLPWCGLALKDFCCQYYPSLDSQAKRKFLVACARFVRRLHDSGLSIEGSLESELMVFVDGAQELFCLSGSQSLVLRCRPLGIRARIKALGGLLTLAFGNTTRTERLRFVTAYLDISRIDMTARWFLRRLEYAGRHQALRHWSRQARRCLTSNQSFVHERRDGFRVHRLRSKDAAAALARLLPDPDRAFVDAIIYKPGSRTHVGLVQLDGRRYFLKRYNAPTGWFGLVNAFRCSRARRTWLQTWGFIARGLPVAQPILCLEKRRWRLLSSCYILMEFMEGTDKLGAVWSHLDSAGQETCLLQLGSVLGRLHYSGGLHGDLKWNNIVLRQDNPTDFHLVDFDGSRVIWRPTRRRAQRDLDRFLRDLRGHHVPDKLFIMLLRVWGRWTGAL